MPPFFDVHGDPNMDPYTILSLPPTASEAEIKKAYRMQMLQLHPDKLSPTLGEDSIADVTEKFHNVKDAYEFLISPVHLTSRRLYMAKMASRRAEYERREAYIRRNGAPRAKTHFSPHEDHFPIWHLTWFFEFLSSYILLYITFLIIKLACFSDCH